jgi:hypothetical protein
VTIGTECPHCESVFQVDAELVGKSMRCPNPTCREVFTVAAPVAATVPPEPPTVELPRPAPPAELAGSVADYLPLVEAERIDPPVPVREAPAVVAVYDAEPLNAAPVATAIPKAAPLPPVQKAAPHTFMPTMRMSAPYPVFG